ncbi:hypothetical protein FVE85_9825 [Porphyridium purpureum]|uniref:Uncharacterized protein n=1 Tax=Porphyridium purpureum TaxID=35688 RepID=A0A5J4YJW9_PORPP|nr:hypothetical protein FVE85_9825 [Porphyridium purpureum]|eukprot:POR3399..scf289_17
MEHRFLLYLQPKSFASISLASGVFRAHHSPFYADRLYRKPCGPKPCNPKPCHLKLCLLRWSGLSNSNIQRVLNFAYLTL